MEFTRAQDEPSIHGCTESLWEQSVVLFSGISQLSQQEAATEVNPENQRVRDALTKLYLWGKGLRNGKLEDILSESEFLRSSITKSLLAIATNLLEWVSEPQRLPTHFLDTFNSQRKTLEKSVTILRLEFGSQDDENDEENDDSSSVSSNGSGRDILEDIIFYVELLMLQVPSLEHAYDQMRQQTQGEAITFPGISADVSQMSKEKGISSPHFLTTKKRPMREDTKVSAHSHEGLRSEKAAGVTSIADVNAQGGEYGSALQAAAYTGSAVEFADMAVESTPEDHPDRARWLFKVGNRLRIRFKRTGSMDNLNRAIEVVDMAVNSRPNDHPDQARWLNSLGSLLGMRFERTGSMDDLERAVEVAHMAVNSTPEDHPDRARWLSGLGSLLGMRFERTGSMNDLNRAIEVVNMAVESTPKYHLDQARWLNGLGSLLGMRFERTGSMNDLERAVEVAHMAVNSTPEDHPDRASWLNNLGKQFGRRFKQTGSMDDLERAVEVAHMAVNSTPEDHPDRARWLSGLGSLLGMRFERTGSMDDLERAVEVAHMAVDSTPEDHPDRARWLSGLGSLLGMRFERTGSMNDLESAVKITDMAVNSTPKDHPDRASWLNNLGKQFGRRFKQTGSMDDLNRAIEVVNMAVESTPKYHLDQARWLNGLGSLLGMRFERTGSMDDLERAVEVAHMAVNSRPNDHPDRARWLNGLGSLLGMRFERTGSMDDLERAVKIADVAVNSIPEDHPDRASWLNNLGNQLGRRFEQTGSMDDYNLAVSVYKQGWSCQNAAPYFRIHPARNAARILASRSNWEESSQLLREALNLLPTVSPRSLNYTGKQDMLAAFSSLASMAAATALNAGKSAGHALQLLEFGRGVIAGLLLELRGDILDLKQQHPDLADEFVSVRDMLNSPVDQKAILRSPNTRRCDVDQKLNKTLTRIRTKPGFHNFLLPPTRAEILATADQGPIIVINLSSYRCDAFLIECSQIRVLVLPKLNIKEVQQRTQDLSSSSLAASSYTTSLLEWLWDTVSCPVLEALGFNNSPSDSNWPRVWWIPTGVLSQLPLHAAGYHTRGSSETVLDRVMSSYALSIKSLIFGRRHHIRQSAGPRSGHALLVAMNKTPGLSTSQVLPYAEKEVDVLNDLCPLLRLKPIRTAHRKDDVLKYLHGCRIFHFAGHGQSDPTESLRSLLLLEDWKTDPLTIGDLRDSKLQENPPFLGYLSACSPNTADRMADEGIHLVSAFHLAGFRHVVGTLWEVSDKHCVDVARVLYETLRDEGMTDVAVCRGLHRALRELRAGHIHTGQEARKAFHLDLGAPEKGLLNTHWIPYVHFGV
ncbi:unnamed protein product [Penicillium manginii]